MRPQHDLIALYRHVLRSGDVTLASRLGRALAMDPRYHASAAAELQPLPMDAAGAHQTAGGQLLDGLVARLRTRDNG